jgi:molybdopterin synthase sulfur carrier subunit
MTLLYFAWVKEKVGVSEERLSPPAEVDTIAKLVAWLAARSAGHAAAFANPKLVKAAVDQVHAPLDASITGAREIAFFPPVTGG